mgnify:FL=1|jgi:hypothetical protein
MTKDEWISRCAARYVERGGLEYSTAISAAEANFDGHDAAFDSSRTDYNPEACADDDMGCWTHDEE